MMLPGPEPLTMDFACKHHLSKAGIREDDQYIFQVHPFNLNRTGPHTACTGGERALPECLSFSGVHREHIYNTAIPTTAWGLGGS